MPVIASTAYDTAETVLNYIRVICNDFEITGGDVITDSAPFTFPLLNLGFQRVQKKLAQHGIETFTQYWWLIGLPSMSVVDPEGRLFINDQGAQIIYPNGVGNIFSLTPQLPTNLVVPTKLWERQNNTTNFAEEMKQPQAGLSNLTQQSFLVDWQWVADSLMFRGALQSQDVKIYGEALLPQLAAVTDPVPIRWGSEAAAFNCAEIFITSRGGQISPQLLAKANDAIMDLVKIGVRRKQNKQSRRRPYSGKNRETQSPL